MPKEGTGGSTDIDDQISLENPIEPGFAPTPEDAASAKAAEQAAAALAAEAEKDKGTRTPPSSTTGDDAVTQTQEEMEVGAKPLLLSLVDDATITDENKAIKAELLTKYGGTAVDTEGNVVDAEGNIKGAFADIAKYMMEDEALTVNADGDEVNAEGEVTRTAYQLAVDTTAVNKIHDNSDYEFKGEDGNNKVYTDNDEGVMDFATDVANDMNEEWKEAFFAQNAELQDVSKHLLGGGTMADYEASVDYSDIDTTKLSATEQEAYVRKSLQISQLPADQVDSIVQMYKDGNALGKQVDAAIANLTKHEADKSTNATAAYEAQIEANNAAADKYWNEVDAIVEKGDLAGISVPKAEKSAFTTYLSAPVNKKGQSQDMLDESSATEQQKLAAAYIRFKKYDYSTLGKGQASNERVKSLREQMRASGKIKTNTPVSDNAGNAARTRVDNEISLSNML